MCHYCDVRGRVWLSPSIRLFLFGLCVAPVILHPQCLDFKPPFRPQQELQFCSMYKYFGCCDYAKDQQLMDKFYKIMDRFDYDGYSKCAGYVQDLLCQVSMNDSQLGKGRFSMGCVNLQIPACSNSQRSIRFTLRV